MINNKWLALIRGAKTRELLKTLAIVLLSVSALTLSSMMGLNSHLFPASSGGEASRQTESSGVQSYAEAASPFFIVVTNDDGERYGAKNDQAAVLDVYGRTSVLLAEALGSSEEPQTVTEEQWRGALGSAGVFFDFLYEQPLSAVAAWLGTDASQGASRHSARRVCLAAAEDALSLYYICAEDGLTYRCATALNSGALSAAQIEESAPNGAKYAFEFGEELSDVDAYTIILGDRPEVFSVISMNPLQNSMDSGDISKAFGMDLSSPYTESNGSVIFVDTNGSTLRIEPDGVVTYRAQDDCGFLLERDGGLNSIADIIDTALNFCQISAMENREGMGISLSGASISADNSGYEVTFDYVIKGIPVRLAEEHAAKLQISGGRISFAILCLRDFVVSDEVQDVLWERPAAAIAQVSGGGEPLLVYEENGGAVRAGWINNR